MKFLFALSALFLGLTSFSNACNLDQVQKSCKGALNHDIAGVARAMNARIMTGSAVSKVNQVLGENLEFNQCAYSYVMATNDGRGNETLKTVLGTLAINSNGSWNNNQDTIESAVFATKNQ